MGSADCGRELRQVRSRVQHTSDMETPSRSRQPTCMHGGVLSRAARGVLTVRQRQPDLALADVYQEVPLVDLRDADTVVPPANELLGNE